MKTELQVTGRVELIHHDISKAVSQYLEKNFDYKVGRIIYPDDQDKIRVIVEVTGKLHNDKVDEFNVSKKVFHNMPTGWRRRNIGVYDTIRALLNDEFIKNDKKETLVSLDSLLKDVVDLHPGMDENKLCVYLYDKRQFGTNVDFSARSKMIVVRSVINH